MKLKKLLKIFPDIQVRGSKEIEITGICSNSKICAPGNIFVAKKGLNNDGTKFINEAINGGANAILTDMFDPTYKNICQLIAKDVSLAESFLVAEYYGNPSEKLHMVGITGTNGKTTVSYLTKYLLDNSIGKTGLIGTIEYYIGDHKYQATHTTPDVTLNHKLLKEMVLSGCKSAVMEVTSHALLQGRVNRIHFDTAVFTNLSQDHLDYHQTMENYCNAKNLLFRNLKQGNCIVNVDDAMYKKIIEGSNSSIFSYGIENPSDLQAYNIKYSRFNTQFSIRYKNKDLKCEIPLSGRFNVYNTLAAFGVGLMQNLPIELLIQLASQFKPIPGRLESIPNDLGIHIIVDFAHSEDALINIFKCIKEFSKGRIITVFGCGGDRDKTKRPKMATAVELYSDHAIVTSDNPRSEDPLKIIEDIVIGFSSKSIYSIEVDRKKAIQLALTIAKEGDTILIAGRGHEKRQIFNHDTIEFCDSQVTKTLCEEFKLSNKCG